MKKRRLGCRFFLMMAALFIAFVFSLLYSTEWLAAFGARPKGARLERMRRSPQFVKGQFRNKREGPLTRTSNREMLRRQFFGEEQRSPLRPIPVDVPAEEQPKAEPYVHSTQIWRFMRRRYFPPETSSTFISRRSGPMRRTTDLPARTWTMIPMIEPSLSNTGAPWSPASASIDVVR